jgi:hypothetical protein
MDESDNKIVVDVPVTVVQQAVKKKVPKAGRKQKKKKNKEGDDKTKDKWTFKETCALLEACGQSPALYMIDSDQHKDRKYKNRVFQEIGDKFGKTLSTNLSY